MVKSFGVPPEDVGYYAGITAASFSLCQFFTGVMWGRLSDRIGRKPVILIGLSGTLVSLLLFVRANHADSTARATAGERKGEKLWMLTGMLGVFDESRSRDIRPGSGRPGQWERWDPADNGCRDGAPKNGKANRCLAFSRMMY